jgi:hypothetical protein
MKSVIGLLVMSATVGIGYIAVIAYCYVTAILFRRIANRGLRNCVIFIWLLIAIVPATAVTIFLPLWANGRWDYVGDAPHRNAILILVGCGCLIFSVWAGMKSRAGHRLTMILR